MKVKFRLELADFNAVKCNVIIRISVLTILNFPTYPDLSRFTTYSIKITFRVARESVGVFCARLLYNFQQPSNLESLFYNFLVITFINREENGFN